MGRGCLAALVILFILSACTQIQGPEDRETPAGPPTTTTTPEATPAETATIIPPTISATNTPEMPAPTITISDQIMTEDGLLTIDEARILEPGWLVVYADAQGEPGDILGFIDIDEGERSDIPISIDPFQATPILYAILHVDDGEIGTFEYPGPDQPVAIDSETVMDAFEVNVQISIPQVSAADQEVTEDGFVLIDRIVAPGPGWIALFTDEDDGPGDLLGYAPVNLGENENVAIKLNRFEASPTLHAILYEDGGDIGKLENTDIDEPVVFDEEPVEVAFRVVLPPDVFVLDQPVLDGSIMVERATSFGPGWLAVYQDDDGELGNIIGWAPLEDGVNHQIVITVTESAVTPVLYLMLHEDLEAVGEFGFPRTDPLVRYQDRLPNPFAIRTDSGNFLITRDQALSVTNQVTIPIVVVDVDSWVVVREGTMSEPGEISGMAWLPAGFHRDVTVEIDPDVISDTMHVVLYLDGGFSQEFEYPEGIDIPLQRNRNVIQAPFQLLQDNDGR